MSSPILSVEQNLAQKDHDEEQQRKLRNAGIKTIIGGILVYFYNGEFFLWGNISLYVVSYFH